MINFDSLKKVLGLVSRTHFVQDVLKKMCPYYILLTDQIYCPIPFTS